MLKEIDSEVAAEALGPLLFDLGEVEQKFRPDLLVAEELERMEMIAMIGNRLARDLWPYIRQR